MKINKRAAKYVKRREGDELKDSRQQIKLYPLAI